MTKAEAMAWAQFERYMAEAQPSLDGCVPVALVCLPVEGIDPDGAIRVVAMDQAAHPRLLWVATFPVTERGPLLGRLAVSYMRGDALLDPKSQA